MGDTTQNSAATSTQLIENETDEGYAVSGQLEAYGRAAEIV